MGIIDMTSLSEQGLALVDTVRALAEPARVPTCSLSRILHSSTTRKSIHTIAELRHIDKGKDGGSGEGCEDLRHVREPPERDPPQDHARGRCL